MAITANVTTVGKGAPQRVYWCASVYSANVSGTEVVKAAPSTGNLYLEQIDFFCSATAAAVTFLDVAAILLGPIPVTTAEMNGHTILTFVRPLKLTGALNVLATSDPICIIVQGYSA